MESANAEIVGTPGGCTYCPRKIAFLRTDKTEVDALIPDVSNFETSNQLDNRLANYTTLSLFEAHEELMEQELNDKQDVPATGEQYALVSQLPDLSNYALSSAIPDVSSFITDSTTGLVNYDTSSVVDSKISSAGVGSFWSKDATTNELSYGAGRVKITTNGEGLVVRPDASDTDARINLISGTGVSDAYMGFHAHNQTYSVHGRSVYIGAKAGDNDTNSTDTDLHFKVRGSSPYEWDTMVSDMVIRGDGNVGINRTDPAERLDILGTLRVGEGDGMLTINNRATTYVGFVFCTFARR